MGKLLYLKDVVTLRLDEEKCVGCGMCLLVCPHAVLSMPDGKAIIENRDACMECGACAQNCPTGAVTVRAGVGCAAAVIASVFGRNASPCSCSCTIESQRDSGEEAPSCSQGTKPGACC